MNYRLRGTQHPRARLTDDAVREIRNGYDPASGISLAHLARRYGVSRQAVHLVVQRKSWTHVEEEA